MLQFHDSLQKKKVAFKPLKEGEITMYNCGPTVYGYVHIGNLRSFLFADTLRRYLEYSGFHVKQIMNITDVGHMLDDADEGEDKLEVAAEAQGKTPEEVAKYYTEAFFRDIDALGIKRATKYPKATESIDAIIALIQKLLDAGKAYKVGGSVYYDISEFPEYGKLSGNTIEGLQPGARVDVRDEKKHPQDFALWIHNPHHKMQWDAPWGKGYPGWHIECSAMAMEELGETIDIHTGGEDNKFPHHECEIAQSEGATGKPFANFWLHATHLLVDGEKMSKSKGNFYTLKDLLDKGYDARTVRYVLIASHYRQQLNFTFEGLDGAKNALERLDTFVNLLERSKDVKPAETPDQNAILAFRESMDDDLNVAGALGVVFDFVHKTNKDIAEGKLTDETAANAKCFMEHVAQIIGIRFGGRSEQLLTTEVSALRDARALAREQKDFNESDRLRDILAKCGYSVEDTSDGSQILKEI